MHSNQLTVAVDVHFKLWSLNEIVAELVLPEEMALLHHYRVTSMQILDDINRYGGFVQDRFLAKFNHSLTENVDEALKRAGLSLRVSKANHKQEL